MTDGFVSSGPEHRDELPSQPPLPRHACYAPLTWGDSRHPPTTTPNARPVRAEETSVFVCNTLSEANWEINQLPVRYPCSLPPTRSPSPLSLGPGMNTYAAERSQSRAGGRERSCSLYRNITRMFWTNAAADDLPFKLSLAAVICTYPSRRAHRATGEDGRRLEAAGKGQREWCCTRLIDRLAFVLSVRPCCSEQQTSNHPLKLL